MFMMGCGTYEVPEGGATVKTVPQDEESDEVVAKKKDNTTTQSQTGDNNGNGTQVNVQSSVNVEQTTINNTTIVNSEAQQFEYIYDPNQSTWQEAVDNAPEGYHLATKAELIFLLDSDEKIGRERVWTATTSKSRNDWAWTVNLRTGNTYEYSKGLTFETVYVENSNED